MDQTEAQQFIAKVLRHTARQFTATAPPSCDCGTCTAIWADNVAAEIDTALGGLRKITSIGQLTPGGFLLYGAEPTQYRQWISGWAPDEASQ
ncbi:hypothetical protein PP713_08580 [Mycobacterium sp. CSUR Q5927]|nr:hypothetical protein [Mycobacterium sp. CSUR Q5927]